MGNPTNMLTEMQNRIRSKTGKYRSDADPAIFVGQIRFLTEN